MDDPLSPGPAPPPLVPDDGDLGDGEWRPLPHQFYASPVASAILVLATTGVMIAAALYLFKPALFAAKEHDEEFLGDTGLGVELPYEEIDAYDEYIEKVLKAPSDAQNDRAADGLPRKKAFEKACRLLSVRAKASLGSIRAAHAEYAKHTMMYRGSGRRGRGGGGIITEEHMAALKEEWAPFQPEMKEIIDQANWLKPGRPGWGAAILQEAYDALLEDWEAEAAKAREAGDEPPPFKKLRFGKGARVECNMGEQRGYVKGTVQVCFELPYLVMLDTGGSVTAPGDHEELIRAVSDPDDKGTPEGIDMSVYKQFRFPIGTVVMANMGKNGWKRGSVTKHAVKGEDGGVRAYGIYIHAMGGEVYAPHDTDQVVRKATAAEATGPPPLRFKKGDRVLCNMGKERGLAPGKIEKVWVKRNPPPNAPPGSQPVMAPYQIQLDEGGFVFAPHDNDSTIRADPNATASTEPNGEGDATPTADGELEEAD